MSSSNTDDEEPPEKWSPDESHDVERGADEPDVCACGIDHHATAGLVSCDYGSPTENVAVTADGGPEVMETNEHTDTNTDTGMDTNTNMDSDTNIKSNRPDEEITLGTPQQASGPDYLTLSTTIDISDASEAQKQMFKEMAQMVANNFETFIEKNLDYGSSFLTSGIMEMEIGGDQLYDDPIHANIHGVWRRADDKHTRVYRQGVLRDDDRVDEDIVESALDNANYDTMIAWLAKYGREHIEEFAYDQ